MALAGLVQALSDQSRWLELEDALTEAQSGDGRHLLGLYDEFFQRRPDGTYDNSIEAYQTISCMDDPERPSVAQSDATALAFRRVAPRISPATVGDYFCTFFPPSIDPVVKVTGKGAGPILVMGITGDPVTPLDSTRKMAEALQDGRLVIVTANQHTGYTANDCSRKVIDDYLIDPVGAIPAIGATC